MVSGTIKRTLPNTWRHDDVFKQVTANGFVSNIRTKIRSNQCYIYTKACAVSGWRGLKERHSAQSRLLGSKVLYFSELVESGPKLRAT